MAVILVMQGWGGEGEGTEENQEKYTEYKYLDKRNKLSISTKYILHKMLCN